MEKKELSLQLNNKNIGDFEYEKDEIFGCSTFYAVGFWVVVRLRLVQVQQ